MNASHQNQQRDQDRGDYGHGVRGGSVPAQEGTRKRHHDNDDDESNKRFAPALLKQSNTHERYEKGVAGTQHDNDTGAVANTRSTGGNPDDTSWFPEVLDLVETEWNVSLTNDQKDAIMALVGAQQKAARLSTSGRTWSTHQPVHTSLAPRTNNSYANLGLLPNPELSEAALIEMQRQKKARSGVAKGYTINPHAPASGNDSQNSIEIDKPAEQIDIPGSPDPPPEPSPLHCDNCGHDGTHRTGRCAIVTSPKEGDSYVDPLCNGTCKNAMDRNNKKMHALQGRQKSWLPEPQISCPRLATAYQNGQIELLFTTFVVDRRRMAPLLVYSDAFCFVRLTLDYASRFCQGRMPEQMQGMWPYTRADAVKYKEELRHFYEHALEKMPKGELEGLEMTVIWQLYKSGAIEPQYRIPERRTGPRAIQFD